MIPTVGVQVRQKHSPEGVRRGVAAVKQGVEQLQRGPLHAGHAAAEKAQQRLLGGGEGGEQVCGRNLDLHVRSSKVRHWHWHRVGIASRPKKAQPLPNSNRLVSRHDAAACLSMD